MGACEHWHGDPESLELTWGAARRFQLTARVGGPDVGAALDALLRRWRVHLGEVSGVDDPDSAAVVLWPSRDIDGIRALLDHGFPPRSVEPTAGGASAEVDGIFDDDPMCMLTTVWVSAQARKNGSQ